MSESVSTVEVASAPSGDPDKSPGGSLWSDAWQQLRKSPVFWLSILIVVVVVSMAAFPGLWTNTDPEKCVLTNAKKGPSDGHIFGSTTLGCDMYTHIIYGARPSIFIAVIVTVLTALIGGLLGILSGFYGGWTDTLISRFTDVVVGLPFLLGALVFLALLL